MRRFGSIGVYELFLPFNLEEQSYHFLIETEEGQFLQKADPYAFQRVHRSSVNSLVKKTDFKWGDREWIEGRRERNHAPLSIYEVHLHSWDSRVKSYLDVQEKLIPYIKKLGYTHVEFMPLSEYPYDESWGYQCCGYFAPTARYGSLEDFKSMINAFHLAGIGVILDWVPAHFPEDEPFLVRFDGTSLYEHGVSYREYHPHWHTKLFNYGRREVSNFLIASALYWIKELHVDGLRVDAVASMLHLDYGREEGQWVPNPFGQAIDLDAVAFIQQLNREVHRQVEGILMIAEDSSSFPQVTHPISQGGLGFDLKWKMGWMHDTLRFFSRPLEERFHYKDEITFGLFYHYSESYLLPISHDEVVHLKKSLFSKLGHSYDQLRLFLAHMTCMPGKKLHFMGCELAMMEEWSEKNSLPWELLGNPLHSGICRYVSSLNQFYRSNEALWYYDCDPKGFTWIEIGEKRLVFSYLRQGLSSTLLIVEEMEGATHSRYLIRLSQVKKIRRAFRSDAARFGGRGKPLPAPKILTSPEGVAIGVEIAVLPFSSQIFEVEFE